MTAIQSEYWAAWDAYQTDATNAAWERWKQAIKALTEETEREATRAKANLHGLRQAHDLRLL